MDEREREEREERQDSGVRGRLKRVKRRKHAQHEFECEVMALKLRLVKVKENGEQQQS